MGEENASFFQRIDAIFPSLTDKQARIAEHFRTNYRRSVFYTLAQAAEATGVSDASIVRFARLIGYDGFSGMQDAVRAYVSASMSTTVERFKSIEAAAEGGLEQLVDGSVRALRGLPLLVEADALRDFARSLGGYGSIQIVGFESTAGFAEYLAYYLSRAGYPAAAVTERSGDTFARIRAAGPGTLVLSIMVARYPRQALEFCRACTARGAYLAVVSDTADHPLGGAADSQFSIATRRSDGMNLEIQAALFASLQFIVLQAGLSDLDRTRASLAELEDYDAAFGIFD
ncbi:MAG: MurR/RpiR family transcriptional regulator [Spirochaetes bacterium]|nr:MurR/RpiR family transcriptional regulator [Spirochaetota bacterium]MBU1081964.1 MurR/RpiR family transcriptional regulator [Spirochaetota bacterium]